ncbi:hypothetical protein TNCV_1653901 [Trichonephila clavipes]|nr:hypothetical protein TNCV_1653901 [Trichonephila clavipes]
MGFSIKHVADACCSSNNLRRHPPVTIGGPQCDKCGWRCKTNYRNSYPGQSNASTTSLTRGRQREKFSTDIAFYRGQKTARWWSGRRCEICHSSQGR